MNEMGSAEYWARIIALETESETLTRRLYGNGQPGDIQRIMATLEELKRAHAKIQGIMFTLGVAMPILLMVIQHLFFPLSK